MKSSLAIFLMLIISLTVNSQTVIKGKIMNQEGETVVGANIYIENTYEGCTSDTDGNFEFKTDLTGKQKLVVSFLGYKTYKIELNLPKKDCFLKIELIQSSTSLDAVVITAGSFDAGDKNKSVALNPLDIATTASASADVYGVLNTLPGTQIVGEDGKIFVRGGESYEIKTYMDGMLVQKPYASSMPDVPTRARFSPFLFSGTVFSTGGYSAEYGQALSSVLLLNTNALATETQTSASIMSVGGNVSHTKRWKNTSISLNADYSNLNPYFSIIKQKIDWINAPQSLGGTMMFRQKTREKGMLKVFGSFSDNTSSLFYNNIEIQENQKIKLKNDNAYFNAVYNDMLNDKWMLKTGLAYNRDLEYIHINNDEVKTFDNSLQFRLGFKNYINDKLNLSFGSEYIDKDYKQEYIENKSKHNFTSQFSNNIFSLYSEVEIRLTNRFAARLGSRFEHSDLNFEFNLVPRISLAMKTGKSSQISLAYGMFYQQPQNDYLKFNNQLNNEKSEHYILNYQYNKNKRLFRVEAYYKCYTNLIKYQYINNSQPDSYNNKGYGYAQGFDVLWRDQKTFKNLEYWISYSFIDTKRDYRNYINFVTPGFASKHNFSVVAKQWIADINTFIGLTYSYSSGRPYNNPNKNQFMREIAPAYNDLSINLTYVTNLFNNMAVVHLALNNVLGFDNTFTYRYSGIENEQGIFEKHPVTPMAKRFVVLVFMFSIN